MPSSDEKYVIGVDYGTLSGRALLVRVSDGAEIATAVFEYPHAVIEEVLPTSGAKLPPDWALQVPSRLPARKLIIEFLNLVFLMMETPSNLPRDEGLDLNFWMNQLLTGIASQNRRKL